MIRVLRGSRPILTLLVLVLVIPIFFGCSKANNKVNGGGAEVAYATPTPEQLGANQDINFSGALRLVPNTSTSLSLIGDKPFAIFVYSHGEKPKECSIGVSGDGSFNGTCADLGGLPWSAVILQLEPSKSLGFVEFVVDDTRSTVLTTGGGKIVMDIVFDSVARVAAATIDLTKSDAFGQERVDAARKSRGGAEIAVGNLTGTYIATCTDKIGFECPSYSRSESYEDEYYVSHWDQGDKQFLSLWNSKAIYDKYIPPGKNEDALNFKLALPAKDIAVDVSSDSAFKSSIDTAFLTLPPSLQQKIKERTSEANDWILDQCMAEEDRHNTITASNCKFVEIAEEVHNYFDFDTQAIKTVTIGRYYNLEEFSGLIDFVGTANRVTLPCDYDSATPTEWCPGNASGNSYNVYKGSAGRAMRLICKVSSANLGETLDQTPAGGPTKAAAILASVGRKSDICEKVQLGSEQLYRGIANSFRSEVLELSSPAIANEERCSRYQKPANFNFKNCLDGEGRHKHGFYYACDFLAYTGIQAGLKINRGNGNIEADPSSYFYIYESLAAQICPVHLTSFKSANSNSWSNAGTELSLARDNNCRSEFLGLNASQQTDRIEANQSLNTSVKDRVLCLAGSVDEKTAVLSLETNSALPSLHFESKWDQASNDEKQTLYCDGTVDGRCTVDGKFVGMIEGRPVRGEFKSGTTGVFQVHDSGRSSHREYDTAKKVELNCVNTKLLSLSGRKTSASDFDATVISKTSVACAEISSETPDYIEKEDGLDLSFFLQFRKQ